MATHYAVISYTRYLSAVMLVLVLVLVLVLEGQVLVNITAYQLANHQFTTDRSVQPLQHPTIDSLD